MSKHGLSQDGVNFVDFATSVQKTFKTPETHFRCHLSASLQVSSEGCNKESKVDVRDVSLYA